MISADVDYKSKNSPVPSYAHQGVYDKQEAVKFPIFTVEWLNLKGKEIVLLAGGGGKKGTGIDSGLVYYNTHNQVKYICFCFCFFSNQNSKLTKVEIVYCVFRLHVK